MKTHTHTRAHATNNAKLSDIQIYNIYLNEDVFWGMVKIYSTLPIPFISKHA